MAPFARAIAGAVLTLSAGLSLAAQKQGPPTSAFFQRLTEQQAGALFHQTILPLFKTKCFGCHGTAKRFEGGLDLRTRDALMKGGEHGAVVIPGSAVRSSLYGGVTWQDESLRMPPKESERLTTAEVASIRAWIDAGATWPDQAPTRNSSAAPTASQIADTWAFQPVKRREIPRLKGKSKATRTPVDAFLLARLKAKGLKPARRADKLSLIRRATYDLTGLPPAPQEVQDFLNDKRADAFDRLVERLLASPRYGEQWGRHWLDVARYSDTAGFSNDFERPNAWRYRDYVIRSFNEDQPFDQFIREQIAGDEIHPENAAAQIAVGFLRMGPWEHTGMSVAAVTRQQFLDDVTNSVGITFLALPLRCARCHDHKFDPIPTRDYYRLQAVFAPAQFAQSKTSFLPVEDTSGFADSQKEIERRLRINEARLQAIKAKAERALADLLKLHGVTRVEELPAAARPKDRRFGLSEADMEQQRVYGKRLAYYRRELQRYQPLAFSLNTAKPKDAAEWPQVRILAGGSLRSPGATVTPGILSATPGPHNLPPSPTGRRTALANWIANPENPLTARVMANRIWQYHFGKGLVETSNNFGKMGKRPTHPELLDWLATYFVEHGWSVKAMHRLIMGSAAYQRASRPANPNALAKTDPENRLLSYFPPRRLTAEELRDSILAVSGELNLKAGGPGSFPEINEDVALQPRQIMGTIAPAYAPSPSRAERHRRTIYTFQARNLANPMLEVFNAPDSNLSCERRDETTVTPQAFTLFNSQFVHDMALAMAIRLVKEAPKLDEQIEHAFLLAYGRRPTRAERRLARRHVAEMIEHHRQTPPVKRERPEKIVRTFIGELSGQPFTVEEDRDLKDYEENAQPGDVGPETRALAELCLVLLNSNEFVYLH